MLSMPGAEGHVRDAIVRHLRLRRDWRGLSVRWVDDPRLERLALQLGHGYEVSEKRADDPAYAMRLSGDFDAYLSDVLCGKDRRELLRRRRRAEEQRMVVTSAGADNIDRHLDALLDLHELRFELAQRHRKQYLEVLASCARSGVAHIQVLWDGERPVAAQVGLVDRVRSVYCGYQGGWDAAYRWLAPGLLIRLEAVRFAALAVRP